jgi:hypothetical protein
MKGPARTCRNNRLKAEFKTAWWAAASIEAWKINKCQIEGGDKNGPHEEVENHQRNVTRSVARASKDSEQMC